MTSTSPVASSGDLVDLVASTGSTIVYPNDDQVIAVLQTRFRGDLPFTRIGSTNYVVVNPLKALAATNDLNAKEYEERCFKDTSLPTASSPKALQPHLYELAARAYLLMRRRNESQAVIFRGITGSGKTESTRLVVSQLLRLSAKSKREIKVADQIKAFLTLLDSFGNSKTLVNPNASRHGRYLELHFNDRGRISAAKVLTFGLDKSRISRLTHEERSFHIFYQLLAGATTAERDRLNLEDPSDYALLASSNCYRLPSGPFSDDATAMTDIRAAMKSLGFKAKHVTSIFNVLVAILLLGNMSFVDAVSQQDTAHVANTVLLDQISHLLGVPSDDLAQTLTNKTNYVRKELYTVLLNVQQAGWQRDSLVRNLYAILFAFIVEMANHKLAPAAQDPPSHTQIILFDQPGYQTRGPTGTNSIALTNRTPLISSAYGQNSLEEFCINFADEMLHSYVIRNTFEDAVGYNAHLTGDGVALHPVATMDNGGCIELLRGVAISERAHKKPGGMLGVMNKAASSFKQGKGGDNRDEEMLQDLLTKFGVHASFVPAPSLQGATDRSLFGVNHYAGSCTYDAAAFVAKDSDLFDCSFVSLLRQSSDPFVGKLFSGPGLAQEKHYQDSTIPVQAQVSTAPLRRPSPITNPTLGTAGEEPAQLDPEKVYPLTTQMNFVLSEFFTSLDKARLWTVSCIRPNDSGSPNSFDKRRVKAQVRSLLLADIVARRKEEFVADFEHLEFCDRYVPTMLGETSLRIRQCAQKNGWKEGTDYVVGHRSIWLSFTAWKVVEDSVRDGEKGRKGSAEEGEDEESVMMRDDATEFTHEHERSASNHYYGPESADNLLLQRTTTNGSGYLAANVDGGYGEGGLAGTPRAENTPAYMERDDGSAWDSDYDRKERRHSRTPSVDKSKEGEMVVHTAPNAVEEVPTSRARRWWLRLVWTMTFWIPTFLLSSLGRMKRPDIQLAWREKVTICMLIFLICGAILFYIIVFGILLCPNSGKVWDTTDLSAHTADNDWWVAVQGRVYDLSNFIHADHSDIKNEPSDSESNLELLAGQDLTDYFPPPLALACPGLVTTGNLALLYQSFTPVVPTALHISGAAQPNTDTALHQDDWYTNTYLKTINQYYKGPLVWSSGTIASQASTDENNTDAKVWASYENSVYDFTDYVYTLTIEQDDESQFDFLNDDIINVFKQRAGQDITGPLNQVLAGLDQDTVSANLNCMNNAFKVGEVDFRKSARCQVQNYMLLAFSCVIMATIGAKFLAALQLTSKRYPEMLDKFVLCQIPCYTEGEDSLRRTIDSLAALKYDDKRKLLFIICDGNIIGTGNDRTTPRIVLDILGVDPKLDPEPLLFKSIGEGSKQLNYGKVYSGLYEFEGHVVPYIVVVKVGKPTERSKPGNRGKRDSQILLMHYLNRVHFDAPMSPLELEIYHQMRNVIGIDPAFYEYIFTVDADTSVTPDSLNRLVARTVDDSSIIGICGETKLDNEEGSWWTMIQVYEYYISHHLAKSFESLFGSVTCLPGCFSLYRIRTADKGRPVIISNRIIDDYAECNVDTLHKKNLFSLGEDRYLTTLLMKHFPTFKLKFTPDAVARTIAPESWTVLLSQRRRWINSTVHNLCELVFLPELCGFCCFSMRFIVFVDLLGTIILPATAVYLLYLIIIVSIGQAPIPVISLALIAAVYGLQAIIFILKREFMLVGWLVIYILSYPVYSFFLPLYSFWCMDDFSWGNTRLVVGEGSNKKILIAEDERFDESMIPLKKFSEYEAEAWEAGSQHSGGSRHTGYSSAAPDKSRSRSRARSPNSQHDVSPSGGDYYRDTNLTYNNTSNPNLRLPHNQSKSSLSLSHHDHGPGSMYGGHPPGSQYGGGLPQIAPLPFLPFGGPGSMAGSEYGHPMMGQPFAANSMYGMGPPPSLAGMQGSQSGLFAPPTMTALGMQRPTSSYSMATSINPMLAAPSMNPNPSDDELYNALRTYLSTQDLMTVTKKTTREAMVAKFPKADLTPRKDFLNQSIDKILSET